MRSFVLGQTESGLPIMGYQSVQSGTPFLILGGVHGDEVEGVIACKGILKALAEGLSCPFNVTVVPVLNEDGFLLNTRANSNGVDLNRNLPTKNWQEKALKPKYAPGPKPNSESENQALTAYIQKTHPQCIVSIHSWKPLLNINGDIKDFAQRIADQTGYEIVEDIGYPTPGSLGTYGLEHYIPVLTYEIERGLGLQKILQIHVPAIINALKTPLKGSR